MSIPPKPRLDLDYIPVDHEGRTVVFVRDPYELVPEGTVVDPGLFPILRLMDGTRSLSGIAAALGEFGEVPTPAEMLALIEQLDSLRLLDSPAFRRDKEAVGERFAAEPLRACGFAGRAYPQSPAALDAVLDEILDAAPALSPEPERIRAIVAPHIDPAAGAFVYGSAYRLLKGRSYDRVIVLGVGHQASGELFIPTLKDFDTPYGPVKTDGDAVEGLYRAMGKRPSDFPHKFEHSIEFQLLFLRRTLAKKDFSVIPVLCGPTQPLLAPHEPAAYRETAGPFLNAIKTLLDDPRTLLVAGVDFCHFGLKFGHDKPAPELAPEVDAHDAALLDRLSALDAPGFWAESNRVRDRFNVCGLSTMFALLEILPGTVGRTLARDVRFEPPTGSAVSFASLVFSQPG